MSKAYEFKRIGTVTVAGARLTVHEYQHGDMFKVGGCQIPAKTKDAAVAKYREYLEKRERNICQNQQN